MGMELGTEATGPSEASSVVSLSWEGPFNVESVAVLFHYFC